LGCSGNCKNGTGICIDNNRNRYEAKWRNGKFYDEITSFYKDGNKFTGMIINVTIRGQGVFETIKNNLYGPLKQVFNKNNTYRIIKGLNTAKNTTIHLPVI
jgi:hypothetical protein